jgi:hypothetical protein
MLSTAQIDALAGLAGRALSGPELSELAPLVEIRNDVAIAALLSVGRVKHGPTQIGPGTIVAVMGEQGGAFLDELTALGETDRTVYWGMDPVRRGAFDLSVKPARDWIGTLQRDLAQYATSLDWLLMLGVVPDPIHYNTVSHALNQAEERTAP